MKKLGQKWAVLFVAFVVMLTALPVSAQVQPGITELVKTNVQFNPFSKMGVNAAISSQNELLITDTDYALDEELDEYVEKFDVVKIKKDGTQVRHSFPNSEIYFFERLDLHVYIVAIHYDDNKVSIYDENFQFVGQYPLLIDSDYEVFQHENYIRIAVEGGQAFTYDLGALTPVSNATVKAPLSAQTDEERTAIVLRNPLGEVQSTISFEHLLVDKQAYIHAGSIQLLENRLTFTYIQQKLDTYGDTADHFTLVTADLQGNVLHEKEIPTYEDRYEEPVFLIYPSMYQIYTHGANTNDAYIYGKVHTYNAATGALTHTATPTPYSYVSRLNDAYYVKERDTIVDVYDIKTNTLQYSLQDDDIYMDITTDAYGIYSAGYETKLYDIKTGKTLKTMEVDAIDFLQDRFLFTAIYNEENDGYDIAAFALHTAPVNPMYEPTKTWTITFNEHVDSKTVTSNTIYVLNENNVKQAVTLQVKNNQVLVNAPSAGYVTGNYTLYIEGVSSTHNIELEQATTHNFTIR